jgi:hypothetical protein
MTSCALPSQLTSLSPALTLSNSTSLIQQISPQSTSGSVSDQKKPRKNRSAYTLFSLDVKPKLKLSSNFKMSCVDLQTTISQLWKNLSDEERKKYQDQANEEKLHYMLKLKKFYENATPETIEEATKPKPKRPYSAYCYFVKEIRQVIKLPDTKFKMQEILKQASEKWRMLTEEEKAVYQEKAKLARENYGNESTDDSETTESIKQESLSENSEKVEKPKKKSTKVTKGGSLNKKRGLHFPKEIQEKMDQIEQANPTKKIKSDNLSTIKSQLGLSKMPEFAKADLEVPTLLSKKTSSNSGDSMEEEVRAPLRFPVAAKQYVPQPQANPLYNAMPAWGLKMPVPTQQNVNLASQMNLMMGFEQMRRYMLSQLMFNNMNQNMMSQGALPQMGAAKIEVKTETM